MAFAERVGPAVTWQHRITLKFHHGDVLHRPYANRTWQIIDSVDVPAPVGRGMGLAELAISGANLRPRLLIADVVGLGKTLEIGLTLAELIRWDAVVIDESHNLINRDSLRNQLAQILAPRTDALLLASVTPHNGDAKSFAELIGLLDPAAIRDPEHYRADDIKHLFIRRTKISPEVREQMTGQWADRGPSRSVHCPATRPPSTRPTARPRGEGHMRTSRRGWMRKSPLGAGLRQSTKGWMREPAYRVAQGSVPDRRQGQTLNDPWWEALSDREANERGPGRSADRDSRCRRNQLNSPLQEIVRASRALVAATAELHPQTRSSTHASEFTYIWYIYYMSEPIVESMAELRTHLADAIDRARRDEIPTVITRRGKEEAVLVDIDEYRRLRRLAEQAEDAWLNRLADAAEAEGTADSVSLEEMAAQLRSQHS
jgi:prevent-host-death family protein